MTKADDSDLETVNANLDLNNLITDLDYLQDKLSGYDDLIKHSNNQRKTLIQQNKDIKHLKDSLDFDDCVVDLDNDTVNKLDVQNHKLNDKCKEYKNRYKAIEKDNANHLGKLIELQHVLNRNSSMEFH